eukprot:3574556-Prymnesium_polylepis.1
MRVVEAGAWHAQSPLLLLFWVSRTDGCSRRVPWPPFAPSSPWASRSDGAQALGRVPQPVELAADAEGRAAHHARALPPRGRLQALRANGQRRHRRDRLRPAAVHHVDRRVRAARVQRRHDPAHEAARDWRAVHRGSLVWHVLYRHGAWRRAHRHRAAGQARRAGDADGERVYRAPPDDHG